MVLWGQILAIYSTIPGLYSILYCFISSAILLNMYMMIICCEVGDIFKMVKFLYLKHILGPNYYLQLHV